ncbi:MAG: hypothetical protein ACXVXP_01615 [Mycobacteriaceae bacterium]
MVGSQWALGPVVAACLLLAGCSGGAGGSSLTIRVPATAAVAPASPAVKPVGMVTALGAAVQASVIDPSTRVLAVLADSPDRVLLLNVDDLAAAPRAVALPARAAQVTLSAPGGPLFVAVPGALLRVDQRTGAVATTKVDADVRSAVELPNGKTAVGTGDGQVLVLGSDGAVTQRIKGMAEASVLASTPQGLVALDRKQTAAISVDLDTGTLGAGIRVGEGATNAVTDRFGRVLVTDTDGGELLELSAGPVMLRQRFPMPGAPYALAYDPRPTWRGSHSPPPTKLWATTSPAENPWSAIVSTLSRSLRSWRWTPAPARSSSPRPLAPGCNGLRPQEAAGERV